MGKFIISKRKNGEFQFTMEASNGEVILTSEGYFAKAGCKNGIDSVRRNALINGRFEKNDAKNGKFYFNLKALNGQVIAVSQMYSTGEARDGGIQSVKRNALDAEVVDKTTQSPD